MTTGRNRPSEESASSFNILYIIQYINLQQTNKQTKASLQEQQQQTTKRTNKHSSILRIIVYILYIYIIYRYSYSYYIFHWSSSIYSVGVHYFSSFFFFGGKGRERETHIYILDIYFSSQRWIRLVVCVTGGGKTQEREKSKTNKTKQKHSPNHQFNQSIQSSHKTETETKIESIFFCYHHHRRRCVLFLQLDNSNNQKKAKKHPPWFFCFFRFYFFDSNL